MLKFCYLTKTVSYNQEFKIFFNLPNMTSDEQIFIYSNGI